MTDRSSSPFISCFKLPVLDNGPLEFTFFFILFQAASPKPRTVWVYLLSCFKWSVLNNGQLEFSFLPCFKWSVLINGQLAPTLPLPHKCHPQCVWSRGITKKLSPLNYHSKPIQRYTIIFPSETTFPLAESDPFSSMNLGIPLLFLIPVKSSLLSCIHTCITSIS